MPVNTGESYYNFPKWEIISKILDFISNNKNCTIPNISKKIGLSYTAIKNIIDELVIYKILEEKNDKSSNKRGRPAQVYKILNPLELVYPKRQYDLLSENIIINLLNEYPENKIDDFFNQIGKNMAELTYQKWIDNNIKIKAIDDFIFNLNDELHIQGIPNEINNHNDKITIKIHNCVFQKISLKFHPKICQIHRSYFSSLLEKSLSINSHVDHTQSISKREQNCTLEIILDGMSNKK